MSVELLLIGIKAWFSRGGSSGGKLEGTPNPKPRPPIPNIQPKVGRQWDGRIPGQGFVTPPKKPIFKIR